MSLLPPLVVPGQTIAPGLTTKLSSGPGSYNDRNSSGTPAICASVLGAPGLVSTAAAAAAKTAKKPGGKIIRVNPLRSRHAPLLPELNSTVYARVARLERTQARCDILVLSSPSSSSSSEATTIPAAYPLRAVLRSQDVRATERDKVVLASAVHVGDIVRASVIGLGDQAGYFLSTAGNEFGVVMAWSEAGNGCVPVSWCEVRDVKTGRREERKVAKPVA